MTDESVMVSLFTQYLVVIVIDHVLIGTKLKNKQSILSLARSLAIASEL